MRVDNLVDERLDPYKAAHAAMKLLKENYEDLGSWPLALTAYNHGNAGMMRAVRESGTRDMGEIVANYKGPRFGFASRNFYAQFLAVREVERNADRFFGPVSRLGAPQFDEHEMTGYVDARVVAKALGVSLDTLKQDNPALLASIWNGNKRIPKGYVVRVNRNNFAGDLASSMNSIASSDFYTAQIQDQTYTVQSGDSLSVIARRYSTSISELVTINQLPNRHSLKIGQKLVLPQQNGAVPTLVVNATETAAPAAAAGTYTVARGDTLSRIAGRFNVPERTLMALNDIRDANRLQPGQKLVLRAEQTVAAAGHSVREEIALSVQGDDGAGPLQQREQAAAVANMMHNINPADYAVAADSSIEVLPEETLGHYADWLRVSSNDLHRLNNLRSQNAVRVGARLKLDFSKVDQARFESRRQQFHSNLQSQYFASWRISDTANYKIRQSDSLASVVRANDIPMWLFRQYNPELNPGRIQIGQTVVIPKVQRLAGN
jgi:membrane-bound lytic murein transglycosylase D